MHWDRLKKFEKCWKCLGGREVIRVCLMSATSDRAGEWVQVDDNTTWLHMTLYFLSQFSISSYYYPIRFNKERKFIHYWVVMASPFFLCASMMSRAAVRPLCMAAIEGMRYGSSAWILRPDRKGEGEGEGKCIEWRRERGRGSGWNEGEGGKYRKREGGQDREKEGIELDMEETWINVIS